MTIEQPVELVELDIIICANTYGVAPCTASIPTTGERKCLNCLADCQDPDNFVEETVTLRFAKPASYLAETGIDVAAASVKSIDFSPAQIDPGETLGTRASIRISFRDHPHSDTGPGFDKYWDERGYDPYDEDNGTFFGRFRARQLYLKGEALRWKLGWVGDELADFETRHFIVESFDGPTPDGVFTITAKDPLKLLDGDRAQAPVVTTGKVASAHDDNDTSIPAEPAGVGNDEYEASGKLNWGGKEVVSFTRAGDTFTVTRAQYNTEAVAHDDEERLQQCLEYVSEDPADMIYDLMVNFGGVDASWIDLPSWQTETATFFGRNFTGIVTEPTPVKQLIDEIIQQAGLAIWWDDVNQEVRLQVLRQIATDAFVFDDSTVVKGSLRVTEQPNLRVSQSWCRFGQTNPLLDLEEEFNFRAWEIGVDGANEENYGSAAVATIFSRWIPIGGRTTAQRANDLKIGRYTNPPRKFAFSLFRGSVDTPSLGGGYKLESKWLQDAAGAREQVPIQITSVRPTASGWDVEALEMRYTLRDSDDLTLHTITIDVDENSIVLRTKHDSLYADAVAGDSIDVTIDTAVIIGATSTSVPALDVGEGDGGTPQAGKWPQKVVNGTRSAGSATLTSVADTTDVAIGQFVRGTGIPAGAKVQSFVANTSITLDTSSVTGNGVTALTIDLVMISVTVKGRLQGAGGAGGAGGDSNPDTNGQPGGAGGTALKARYGIDLILNVGNADIFGGGGGGGGGATRNPNDHGGGGGGGGAGRVAGAGGIPNGNVPNYNTQAGDAGTLDAGGAGGIGYTNTSSFALPSYSNVHGGDGGDPGQAGQTGDDTFDTNPGSGGAAGKAIDGVSYCKKTGAGDIRGSETG